MDIQLNKSVKPDVAMPSGILPWIMWSLGALFYFYEFLLQVSPSVMVNDLMRAFHVNATQVSNLSAAYLYAYAIMQIPIGMLLDKLGPRRLMTIACGLCAIGSLIFSVAHLYAIAMGGRFLIGLGSAFAVVSCMQLAATWLPPKRFALMTGFMLSIGTLGAVFGQAPLSFLMSFIGWRDTMSLLGIIGIFISLAIWLVVRDRPMRRSKVTNARYEGHNLISAVLHVIRNRQTWIVTIYAGLMYLPTPAFAGLWGVSFLMSEFHLARTSSALFVSLIFIGWAVGSPLFGWYSDLICRRLTPMYISSIGALICLSGVIYMPDLSLIFSAILLFLFGFFSGGFLAAFSVAREINPPEANATSLGVVNTFNAFGGALGQLLIGVFLDLHWQGGMLYGTRFYSVHDFHIALLTLPVCIFISLCTLPFIRETYCRSKL